jgi:hypothetical protein
MRRWHDPAARSSAPSRAQMTHKATLARGRLLPPVYTILQWSARARTLRPAAAALMMARSPAICRLLPDGGKPRPPLARESYARSILATPNCQGHQSRTTPQRSGILDHRAQPQSRPSFDSSLKQKIDSFDWGFVFPFFPWARAA